MTRILLIAMVLVAALLSYAPFLASARTVHAHGADWEVQIVGQRVGGYDVTVRTEPKRPQVGRLHIEVQLMNSRDLTYVGDATVTAIARFRGGEPIQAGPVPSRYREQWHEMDLSLAKSGPWDVHLAIDGPRGQGETSFRVDILPKESGLLPNPLSPWTVSAAVVVVGGIAALYVWRRSRLFGRKRSGEEDIVSQRER